MQECYPGYSRLLLFLGVDGDIIGRRALLLQKTISQAA